MLRTRGKKKHFNAKTFFRANWQIRVPQVMVIDENSRPLGVMPTSQALDLAAEKELDLIEINPKAQPPICKILSFGQFQYQQSRKLQEQKQHAKKVDLKGIRLSYKIDKHDLEFKKNQALKFLERGDKVKIEVILRGREKQYTAQAVGKIQEFIKSLDKEVVIEQPLKRLGGQISTLISLKK